MMHVYGYPWSPEEDVKSLAGGCKSPSVLEPNSGPLEEQQMLLTIELSLSLQRHLDFMKIYKIMHVYMVSSGCRWEHRANERGKRKKGGDTGGSVLNILMNSCDKNCPLYNDTTYNECTQ